MTRIAVGITILMLVAAGCGATETTGGEPGVSRIETGTTAGGEPAVSPTLAAAAAPAPTATPAPGPTTTPESAPSTSGRKALAEDLHKRVSDAWIAQDWTTMYFLMPQEFRDKCNAVEFSALMLHTTRFISLDGAEYVHKSTRIEGYFAYIDSDFVKDGVSLGLSDDPDVTSLVWRDGRWQGYMSEEELADEAPCDPSASGSRGAVGSLDFRLAYLLKGHTW